jgi:hypothetical protein
VECDFRIELLYVARAGAIGSALPKLVPPPSRGPHESVPPCASTI